MYKYANRIKKIYSTCVTSKISKQENNNLSKKYKLGKTTKDI